MWPKDIIMIKILHAAKITLRSLNMLKFARMATHPRSLISANFGRKIPLLTNDINDEEEFGDPLESPPSTVSETHAQGFTLTDGVDYLKLKKMAKRDLLWKVTDIPLEEIDTYFDIFKKYAKHLNIYHLANMLIRIAGHMDVDYTITSIEKRTKSIDAAKVTWELFLLKGGMKNLEVAMIALRALCSLSARKAHIVSVKSLNDLEDELLGRINELDSDTFLAALEIFISLSYCPEQLIDTVWKRDPSLTILQPKTLFPVADIILSFKILDGEMFKSIYERTVALESLFNFDDLIYGLKFLEQARGYNMIKNDETDEIEMTLTNLIFKKIEGIFSAILEQINTTETDVSQYFLLILTSLASLELENTFRNLALSIFDKIVNKKILKIDQRTVIMIIRQMIRYSSKHLRG